MAGVGCAALPVLAFLAFPPHGSARQRWLVLGLALGLVVPGLVLAALWLGQAPSAVDANQDRSTSRWYAGWYRGTQDLLDVVRGFAGSPRSVAAWEQAERDFLALVGKKEDRLALQFVGAACATQSRNFAFDITWPSALRPSP